MKKLRKLSQIYYKILLLNKSSCLKSTSLVFILPPAQTGLNPSIILLLWKNSTCTSKLNINLCVTLSSPRQSEKRVSGEERNMESDDSQQKYMKYIYQHASFPHLQVQQDRKLKGEYCIRPNHCIVRWSFSKILGKLVVKYVPTMYLY